MKKNSEDPVAKNMKTKTLQADELTPAEHTEKSQAVHGTVEFLMRRMHHKGDLPSFSNHMIEINSKLSSLTAVNNSSAGELAKIILKDFSLTNKLLKIVNSALYAGLSGKVTTISKALFLLGVERVRMITAALMIFDHLENKSQAKELQELAFSSFVSGMVAMGMAEKMKFEGKEEAFICAMLYNLGKILVICYFPEEYEEIKKQMPHTEMDETRASKSVLGISYNDLGMAVSRSWNFPEKIVKSMDSLPPAITQPKTEQENLRLLSNFSNELLFKCTDEFSERTEVISDMLKRYNNIIPLSEENVGKLLESAVTDIPSYYDVIITDKQTAGNMISRLLKSDQDHPPKDEKGKSIQESQSPTSSEKSADKADQPGIAVGEPPISILTNGLHEIRDAMKGRYNLSDVLYMILETMYRGFGFSRVIFCLLNAAQGTMAARFGLGENVDEIIKSFYFRISRPSDIFNIIIAQKKGILIENANSPNIIKILPEWYRHIINAPSFLIYPLITPKGCIGMFYADRQIQGTTITGKQEKILEELRDLFVQAITHKQ